MKSFLSPFGSLVLFVLSGFDRLRLAGESRLLNHSRGVQSYLWQQHDKEAPLANTLRLETTINDPSGPS